MQETESSQNAEWKENTELRLISSELDGSAGEDARGTLDYLDVRERVWNENGAEWSGRSN